MKKHLSCDRLLVSTPQVSESVLGRQEQERSAKGMPRRMAQLAGAALVALTVLSGCAVNDPVQSGNLADADRVNTPQRERAQIRLALAMGYFENKQYDVALDEASKALDVDPNLSEAYTLRGLSYSQLGEQARAEASFQRALQIRPNDVDARHNLGVFYCQNNQLQQAVLQFQQAVAQALVRERGKTLLTMGICQARLGDKEGAEQSLQQAHALDPGDPMVSYNLAMLQYQRGAYEPALAVLRHLNNSQYANAESMWLGVRTARKAGDGRTMRDLGEQLRRRFASSREYRLFQQGVFDD